MEADDQPYLPIVVVGTPDASPGGGWSRNLVISRRRAIGGNEDQHLVSCRAVVAAQRCFLLNTGAMWGIPSLRWRPVSGAAAWRAAPPSVLPGDARRPGSASKPGTPAGPASASRGRIRSTAVSIPPPPGRPSEIAGRPPAPDGVPTWGLGEAFFGLVASQAVAGLVAAIVLGLGGWDVLEDCPMWATALITLSLHATLAAVAIWASITKGFGPVSRLRVQRVVVRRRDRRVPRGDGPALPGAGDHLPDRVAHRHRHRRGR